MSQKDVAALMGQKVVIWRQFRRHKEDGPGGYYAWWQAEKAFERTGWVVGIRYLPSGHFERESGGSNYFGEDDWTPAAWKQSADHKPERALMVCLWPSEKPYLVPLDSYRLATEADSEPFSAVFGFSVAERERQLKLLADAMKEAPQPRGAKGRYVRQAGTAEEAADAP